MNKINEVIVVEGKNDSKRLKSFFNIETIETHGLGIKKETIDFIKEVNEKRGVILFLDPDTPGEKIRNILNNEIPNLKNAFVLKENARTTKKVGIEHASKETLEEALNNLITYNNNDNQSITMDDLYLKGYMGNNNSVNKRLELSKRYHLGKCNAKTLLKRLNMLGISPNDI